jgi:hypothetical protein
LRIINRKGLNQAIKKAGEDGFLRLEEVKILN